MTGLVPREVEEQTDYIPARNGQPEETSSTISKGVMVEVLLDGQFAYVGSGDNENLQAAFDKACELARACTEHKLFSFNPTVRPSHHGGYNSDFESDLDSLSFGDIQEKNDQGDGNA